MRLIRGTAAAGALAVVLLAAAAAVYAVAQLAGDDVPLPDDLGDAHPQPAAVPAGFVIHDALGSVHEPAPPTEDCDASFGDDVTPGVPVSACVPFALPGSLPVFAIEWSLDPSPAAAHGDLSWLAA